MTALISMLRKKIGTLGSVSLLLMVSMTVVNVGNYVYNLLLGRWLGPALFADVSLIVTLLLVLTFITASLQMTCARYSAIHAADGNIQAGAAVYRWLTRVALGAGLAATALFTLGAPVWAAFFNTASTLPFILFGLALPFSMMQGVNRGVLQGQTRFVLLAITYQVEMWSRLLVGLLLVWLGFSVNGAVLGISLSFVFTWLATLPAVKKMPLTGKIEASTRKALSTFMIPALVAQVGQILINNSDLLLVRHFFSPLEAGQYAALALIGRIVFFATWSVVTTMFPLAARRQQLGQPHRHLLWISFGIVAGVSLPILLGTLLFPVWIVQVLFGAAYLGISPLLWQYALATALYAMANVVVNYRLSLGMGRGTTYVIIAGSAQVVGISLFHQTLAQVVWVQVAIMVVLFTTLLVWDWLTVSAVRKLQAPAA